MRSGQMNQLNEKIRLVSRAFWILELWIVDLRYLYFRDKKTKACDF